MFVKFFHLPLPLPTGKSRNRVEKGDGKFTKTEIKYLKSIFAFLVQNQFKNKLYHIVNHMVNVYLLKLEDDKYYIGKSRDPITRFEQHKTDVGSAWTTKYKPLELMKVFENCDEFDEDKYTKVFMAEFGIDNVRGGSYVQINLDAETIKLLEKELKSATNLCFKCGANDHFIAECNTQSTNANNTPNNTTNNTTNNTPNNTTNNTPNNTTNNTPNNTPNNTISTNTNNTTNNIPNNTNETNTMSNTIPSSLNDDANKQTCDRCERPGHSINECFAKTHVDGHKLKSSLGCYRCGREGHFIKECYAKYHVNGERIRDKFKKERVDKGKRPCLGCGKKGHKLENCKLYDITIECTRCGRDDHWILTCTEDKDINGYELKSHLIGTIGSFIKSWF
jgi:hypothetical protein